MGKNGRKIGQIVAMIVMMVIMSILLAGCSGSSYSYSGGTYSGGSSSSKRNGYDMPKQGENFSDYVKRVDPDLYKDMQKQYDTAKKNGW